MIVSWIIILFFRGWLVLEKFLFIFVFFVLFILILFYVFLVFEEILKDLGFVYNVCR